MPVNANPELKVNLRINFSCIQMFFTAFVLCSLRLLKLKTEGQTTYRPQTFALDFDLLTNDKLLHFAQPRPIILN